MDQSQITYFTFGIVLILAVIIDLGLLSKKSTVVSIKLALFQTIFWVALALAFFIFLWFEKGDKTALEYLSAYLMEWSLSIDNIFVFILIFSFFGIQAKYYGRVLLIGILLAIILRILFITVGIVLVTRFHLILYLFGGILIYTGIAMFRTNNKDEPELEDNRVYKFLKKFFPLTTEESGGKLSLLKNGKRFFTNLFVVIILLATTDVLFAIDSIPAVFGISQDKIVIYTSNIFAVLGLRSLFFLLSGAVNKFTYLPKGIASVLIFVGVKMLVEVLNIYIPIYASLLVILLCISISVFYSSSFQKRRNSP